MPSRRITSNVKLKPVQSVTVDAFSKFNSDNINRLSKIVSGSGNTDLVVNGLDVAGIAEYFSFKSNDLLKDQSFVCSESSYVDGVITFNKQNKTKYYDYVEFSLNKENFPCDGSYTGYFELKFRALNGTPSNLVFNLNKHVIDIKHLDGYYDETSKSFKLIFPYDFHFDQFFKFRIGIFVDTTDSQTILFNDSFQIKDLSLRQIFDNSKLDYYVSEEYLDGIYGDSVVHPIHKLKVTPGVAIKDNITLDILKGNFKDSDASIILDVRDEKSWVINKPYTISDFAKRLVKKQNVRVRNNEEFTAHGYIRTRDGKLAIYNNNDALESTRVLTDDFTLNSTLDKTISITKQTKHSNILTVEYRNSEINSDAKWLLLVSGTRIIGGIHNPKLVSKSYIDVDLENETIDLSNLQLKVTDGPIKVDGKTYTRRVAPFGYVVVKYSYFKDPVPNKSYIGLIREEDLFKPQYREDYLILAKVRFVDCDTIDLISYSNSRQCLGAIDAEDISYWITCKNGEIWNDDVPNTVTDAIDAIRVKQIADLLKTKYKHDYDAEISTAFQLSKETNGSDDIKSNTNISKSGESVNHFRRDITRNKNIVITSVTDPEIIEEGLSVGSIFTLNTKGTHYLTADNKWAIQSDFKAFGKYVSEKDIIYRKYIGFNTSSPFKYLNRETKKEVIKADWIYEDSDLLIYPTCSPNNNDIGHGSILSYTNSEGSKSDEFNSDKNHQKYLIFRSRFTDTEYVLNYLDKIMPKYPETLIQKRVLFGYMGEDNQVHVQSSYHEFDDNMIDKHLLTSITTSVDPHKFEKSTNIIIDDYLQTEAYLTSKDVSKEHDKSTVEITSTNVYHKNLTNDSIVISTDADDRNIIHVESSEYGLDDIVNKYWFEPKISFDVDLNKLIITMDSEKNFIIRVSELIKWLDSNDLLKTYLNLVPSLNNRKLFDLRVEVDVTKSRNRILDRNISDERFFYKVLEKYFTSKLVIVNDLNESYEDESIKDTFFNTYISSQFKFFYRYKPESYDLDTGSVNAQDFNESSSTLTNDLDIDNIKIYLDDNKVWWKDDRRGYNNGIITKTGKKIISIIEEEDEESGIVVTKYVDEDGNKYLYEDISKLSPLYLYPCNSKEKVNKTYATNLVEKKENQIDTFNAPYYARGCIRNTYAGARTEYNFRYLKKIPDSVTNSKYDIDTDLDNVMLATSDYYVIPNIVTTVRPVPPNMETMNWIFTTDDGVISVLYDTYIVSDYLDTLELYEIPNVYQKDGHRYYEENPVCICPDGLKRYLNDKSEPQAGVETDYTVDEVTSDIKKNHIRYHKFENVSNNNNGCISLSNKCGDSYVNADLAQQLGIEYCWVVSFDGGTGIWRAQDNICKNPFKLLSTSLESDSTSFDVKKMISWKNGDINQQCLLVLSSDTVVKNSSGMAERRSTIETIPYTSIFGTTINNVPDYITNIPEKVGGNVSISRTCISYETEGYGGKEEWFDHLLVNDIAIANDGTPGIDDKMIYLGKQRKDEYRFPPGDYSKSCSDTVHHSSILHNGIDPKSTEKGNKGKANQYLKDVGFDIRSNSILNLGFRNLNSKYPNMGALNFDNSFPSESIANVIYTRHLDNGEKESFGNRFVGVGSAINFNTSIDWELSSFMSVSKNAVNSDVSSSVDIMTLVNPIRIGSKITRYGIFKKVYEFDGHFYITTTNGILYVDNLVADGDNDNKLAPSNKTPTTDLNVNPHYNGRTKVNEPNLEYKFITFEDSLKHTKWDDLPYNYQYSHDEKGLSWMIPTPVNGYNTIVTDRLKLKDGCFFICGQRYRAIYNRDGWTYIDSQSELTNQVIESQGYMGTDTITTIINTPKCTFDKQNQRVWVSVDGGSYSKYNSQTKEYETITDSILCYELESNTLKSTKVNKYELILRSVKNLKINNISINDLILLRCIPVNNDLYLFFNVGNRAGTEGEVWNAPYSIVAKLTNVVLNNETLTISYDSIDYIDKYNTNLTNLLIREVVLCDDIFYIETQNKKDYSSILQLYSSSDFEFVKEIDLNVPSTSLSSRPGSRFINFDTVVFRSDNGTKMIDTLKRRSYYNGSGSSRFSYKIQNQQANCGTLKKPTADNYITYIYSQALYSTVDNTLAYASGTNILNTVDHIKGSKTYKAAITTTYPKTNLNVETGASLGLNSSPGSKVGFKCYDFAYDKETDIALYSIMVNTEGQFPYCGTVRWCV